MLGHVPLGDVLLPAILADEGPDTLMLTNVHIVVGPGVVLLVAALVSAMELINVLMGLLMVAKYPVLTEFRVAPGVGADELLVLLFFVSGHVIGQVLGHLEALRAPRVSTLVKSHGQMAFEMLPQF